MLNPVGRFQMLQNSFAIVWQSLATSATDWLGLARFKKVCWFVIAAVTLVVYYPALTIGFFGDDWFYLDRAGRLSLAEYVRFYSDPAYHSLWFRPLHGVLLRAEFALFDGNPAGYHLVQVLLHLGISLFLFSLASQITGRWRIGFSAALLYAILATHSLAVYWVTVHDPLAVFFFLAALWFWLRYLTRGRKLDYGLTLFTTACALLSKEISITLPFVLVLVDLLVVRKKEPWTRFIAKYFAFGVILAPYLMVEYVFQSHSSFVKGGYGFGPHVIYSLARYGTLLLFSWLGMPSDVPEVCTEIVAPWDYIGCYWLLDHAIIYLTAFLGLLAFLTALVFSRRRELLFWGGLVLVVLLPVVPFPEEIWGTRYLYAPTLGMAVLFSWAIDTGRVVWHKRKFLLVALAVGFGMVMFVNSLWIADAKAPLAERERQRRVPFRDIAQAHPTFPNDTYLYFVGASDRRIIEFSAMFLARYGKGVVVGGTGFNVRAGLRDHYNPLVYYFDEVGRPVQVAVNRETTTISNLDLPVNLGNLRLEGYELASSRLKRNGVLILLLYWKATAKVDEDYTVFVHLTDEKGQLYAGYDSQPRNATLPTSSWQVGQLISDAVVVQIPDDVPVRDDYRLEIGLYYLPTLERLSVEVENLPLTDRVIIERFSVTE